MISFKTKNRMIKELEAKVKALDALLIKHNVYEKDRRLEEKKKLKNS